MGGGDINLWRTVELEKLGGSGSEALKEAAKAIIRLGNELLALAELGYCSVNLDSKSLVFELFQENLFSILILDTPVSRFFFEKTRTGRVLEKLEVVTVRDLVTKERWLIASTPGAGNGVMGEIDEFMASNHLEYGTPAESLPNQTSFADLLAKRR